MMTVIKYIYPLTCFIAIIITLGHAYRRYFYHNTILAWSTEIALGLNSLAAVFYAFMHLSSSIFTAYTFVLYANITTLLLFPVLVVLTVDILAKHYKKNIKAEKKRIVKFTCIIANLIACFFVAIIFVFMYFKPPLVLSIVQLTFQNLSTINVYGWSNTSIYCLIANAINLFQLNLLFLCVLIIQRRTAESISKSVVKKNIALWILCNIALPLIDVILPAMHIYKMPTLAPVIFGVMLLVTIQILGYIPQNKIFPQVFSLKIFDSLEDAVAFVDADFKIIYTNAFFKELFELKDVMQKDIRKIFPANFDMEKLKRNYQGIIQVSTSKKKYLKLKYAIQKDAYGDLLGGVLIFHDFTALIVESLALSYEAENINANVLRKSKQIVDQNKYMQEQIKRKEFLHNEYMHLLQIDTITQAYNRDYFLRAVERKIANTETGFCVFSIDIKNFKYINDVRGHWIGDLVLVKFADAIHKLVGNNVGVLARTDSDNFLLLHNSIDNQNDAIIFSRVLSNFVSEIKMINNFEVSISAAVGICLYEIGMDAEEIINNAELANLQANTQNTERYVVFTPEISKTITERFKLIAEMKHSCEHNEFIPYYQPQVLVKRDGTKKIIGYESLARWQHPSRGVLTPYHFLEVAEACGSIVQISYSILRQACENINTLIQKGFDEFTVSVNLSAKQLNSELFIKTVSSIFEETNVDTSYLEFEITETELLVYNERVLVKCLELKRMGIRISIDDFGVAFASFNYVKTLPIDKMKIDKSFVDEIGKSQRVEQILHIVMQFAKLCNLKLVIEGVEHKEQLDFLLAQNDDIIIQGYYFYKPIKFETLLEENIFPHYDAKHMEIN